MSAAREGLRTGSRRVTPKQEVRAMKGCVFFLCALAATVGVATAGAQRAATVRVQGDLALGWLCNYYSGPVGAVQGQSTVAIAVDGGADGHRAQVNVRTNGLAAGLYTVELTKCSGDVFPQPAITLGTIYVGKNSRGNLAASTVLAPGDYDLQTIVRYGAGGPNAYIALATEPALLELS